MRLNAYLARAGVASRRGAEELIRAGRVRVNGEVAGFATFVEARDHVELDGKPLERIDDLYAALDGAPDALDLVALRGADRRDVRVEFGS
jgi:23S rRNA pseudouridine2605 synthase